MPDEDETKTRSAALGAYLKSVRLGLDMSLRQVEENTDKEISNAYLSQLENGKIAKPSPHVLHTLSQVYRVSYEKLMERAGYLAPAGNKPKDAKHGHVATFSIDKLSAEEEKALLDYLAFVRSKKDHT